MLLHNDGRGAKKVEEGHGEVEESTIIRVAVVLLVGNVCIKNASSARAKRSSPSFLLPLVALFPPAPALDTADAAPA